MKKHTPYFCAFFVSFFETLNLIICALAVLGFKLHLNNLNDTSKTTYMSKLPD